MQYHSEITRNNQEDREAELLQIEPDYIMCAFFKAI